MISVAPVTYVEDFILKFLREKRAKQQQQRDVHNCKLSLYKFGSSWIKDINIHSYKGLYSREIVVNDWFREARHRRTSSTYQYYILLAN